jgi:hypothetical protein
MLYSECLLLLLPLLLLLLQELGQAGPHQECVPHQ